LSVYLPDNNFFPTVGKSQSGGNTGNYKWGGIYEIKNVQSGKYINVHMGYDADEINVYQWTRDSSTEQKFKVVYISSTDSYRFYAMCSSNGTNRVLDIEKSGGIVANGCNVEIYRPIDPVAQEWKIINVGTAGRYKVVPRTNTGVALTANGDSNGTSSGQFDYSPGNVFVATCSGNGTTYQQWDFVYQGADDHSDTASGATTVTVGGYKDGILNSGTDQDWFKFDAKSLKTGRYIIKTTGTTDTYGRLYQGTSTYLTGNNDSGAGTNFQIVWTVSAGWYYVKVTGNNSAVGSYRLYVTEDDYSNTSGSAKVVNIGSNMAGALDYSTDLDWFKFTTTTAGYYIIKTTGSTDTQGSLYNSSVSLIESNSNDGLFGNFQIVRSLSANTLYYVRVSGENSETGLYTFSVQKDDSNSSSGATTIAIGGSKSAGIDYIGDIDWFKFEIPASGEYEIYTSGSTNTYGILYQGTSTLLDQNDNGGTGNNFKITKNLNAGWHYIRVTGSGSGTTGSYVLYVKAKSLQWYSQFTGAPTGVTSANWNTTNLNNTVAGNLWNTGSGWARYRWHINGDYSHIKVYGCYVSSIAMILKNLGRTSNSGTRQDLRTGTSGTVIPDPFTVTWANTTSGSTWQPPTTHEGFLNLNSGDSWWSPTNCIFLNITNKFGVTRQEYLKPTGTKKDIASWLHTHIQNNPQGILVRFNGHSVVFATSSYDPTYTGTNWEQFFTMYDPGTSNAAAGNGIPYSSSIYGELTSILYIETYN